jgi:hypothetical protein
MQVVVEPSPPRPDGLVQWVELLENLRLTGHSDGCYCRQCDQLRTLLRGSLNRVKSKSELLRKQRRKEK